ncbi:MAG: hypothetical protein L6V88_04635 [Anaerotruncus sp.]|nr:MAG: hypothetical protein L6V88_04635 [Anaerotruncus sp.]
MTALILPPKIVILLAKLNNDGKKIDDLISELKEPAESVEIRIPILLDDFRQYGEKGYRRFERAFFSEMQGYSYEPVNYEGVRFNIPGGWFLLRLSVHDPILPLNIEK